MGAWVNHTKDLSELTQASNCLLGEAEATKEAVHHCHVTLGSASNYPSADTDIIRL
jgi:hypothetical protein